MARVHQQRRRKKTKKKAKEIAMMATLLVMATGQKLKLTQKMKMKKCEEEGVKRDSVKFLAGTKSTCAGSKNGNRNR